jgi:subtilisin family serine protease
MMIPIVFSRSVLTPPISMTTANTTTSSPEETYTIKGSVKYPNGEPVRGVKIQAMDSDSGSISTNFSEEGEDQIVGVIDSGIDKDHRDFQGRIIAAIREVTTVRPNDTSDYNGHGTHVTGSILGNGTASNKKIRGVAPKVKLFFQSVGGEGREVIMPYDEREKIFIEFYNRAYDAGVRISNSSLGAPVDSIYYFSARL